MKSQATHHLIFCSDCLSGDFSRRQEENQAGGRFLVSPPPEDVLCCRNPGYAITLQKRKNVINGLRLHRMKNSSYTIFHIAPMQETREFSKTFVGMVRIYQLFKGKV